MNHVLLALAFFILTSGTPSVVAKANVATPCSAEEASTFFGLGKGNLRIYEVLRTGTRPVTKQSLISDEIESDSAYVVSELFDGSSIMDQPLIFRVSGGGSLICDDCGGTRVTGCASVGDVWRSEGLEYEVVSDRLIINSGGRVYDHVLLVRSMNREESAILDYYYKEKFGLIKLNIFHYSDEEIYLDESHELVEQHFSPEPRFRQ